METSKLLLRLKHDFGPDLSQSPNPVRPAQKASFFGLKMGFPEASTWSGKRNERCQSPCALEDPAKKAEKGAHSARLSVEETVEQQASTEKSLCLFSQQTPPNTNLRPET